MKPAFYIYHEDMETIEDLTDEELGMLVRLLNAYSKGEEVDVPDHLKFPFRFMAKKIEKDASAYQEKVNKSKKAAEKRWQKDADESDSMQTHTDTEDDMQTDADACECMQTHAIKLNQTKPNQTKLNQNNSNTIKKSSPQARECDFDELWNLYPKKQGRREAFEAFKRAIRDGDTVDEIRQGIRNYSAFIIKNKTEPRYIKQGSTYFRQRAWKDKYDLPMASGFDYDMRTDDMSDVLMEL